MLEFLQNFFRMDDATFTFAGWYIVLGLGAYVLGVFYVSMRKRPAQTSRHDGAKKAPVQFAIRLGERFVSLVLSTGVSPNQITIIGLVLVCFNCGLFVWSANTLWFGSGLIAALLFDSLDGIVARAQGASSKFGGYLDAVIDRYQEVAVYLSIGLVTGLWIPVFLVMTGSFLTSYNKARVALEIPTDNKEWPDLLERPTRLFILCVGLIGAPILDWFLPMALWMLVVMTHFTALQRFTRARFALEQDAKGEEI